MKICFLATEIFAWGKYGGFGRATRAIGSELVNRGIEVYAIVPRRTGQEEYEVLDGIKVYGFQCHNIFRIMQFAKTINADIYHTEEPSMISVFAKLAMPHKKHIVTFRDPRNSKDWRIELREHSLSKWQVICNYFFENNLFVHYFVRNCDGTYAAA
ncbi:glycosyltransferase family 4 protein, partial [Candidatus Omnitrophota bacterium]